jgi:hypothetical protein
MRDGDRRREIRQSHRMFGVMMALILIMAVVVIVMD